MHGSCLLSLRWLPCCLLLQCALPEGALARAQARLRGRGATPPPAPTAAQGGGAGAGAASGGGSSAAPASAPTGRRFLYAGMEQVVEDPRCGKCGKDLSHRGRGCKEEQMACGACRKVPYCDRVCLESHYLGHMEECFEVIRDRVLAGDVHKDDYSGEYVLKDYVGECTSKYGALDVRTLTGQRIYGVFLRRLGRLEEAKILLLAARKGFQDSFGPRRAGTLVCISDLAQLLKAQGKLDEAKPLMLEVLEARRATLGPKHPNTLNTIKTWRGCCTIKLRWAGTAMRGSSRLPIKCSRKLQAAKALYHFLYLAQHLTWKTLTWHT